MKVAFYPPVTVTWNFRIVHKAAITFHDKITEYEFCTIIHNCPFYRNMFKEGFSVKEIVNSHFVFKQ